MKWPESPQEAKAFIRQGLYYLFLQDDQELDYHDLSAIAEEQLQDIYESWF